MKVRGAHSGFLKDNYCHTDGAVACQRVMLLRDRGVEEYKSPETLERFALGNGNENYFCDTFLAGVEHQRDVLIEGPNFEGHADAIAGDTVYELKSVTSNNVWRNVCSGDYKLSNLAQLVGYMLMSGRDYGVLAYTKYVDKKPTDTIQFAVKLTSSGAIVVNGVFTKYTTVDWWNHHKYMVAGLLENWLNPDRPVDPKFGFNAPCMWCTWNPVCDKFNAFTQDSEKFVDMCRESIKPKTEVPL